MSSNAIINRAGPWPLFSIPRLRVPHRWSEPWPVAGFQVLFSPGGPANLGLHIGFVHRATPDAPPSAFGYYPEGHHPGGENTRLKRSVLLAKKVPGYVCTHDGQMSDRTVYVPLGLTAEENDRLLDWIRGAGNRGTYQFYTNNCAHWCANALNHAAGFRLRRRGVLACEWVFAALHRRLMVRRVIAC